MRDRFRGCLVGLGVGDALGAAVEFMTESEVAARYGRVVNYVTAGWVGQYTDDTAMALCIARSIVTQGCVDLGDIARRFVQWMVMDGRGIGNQTAEVLSLIQRGEEPMAAARQVWEAHGCQAAGNGGVMRCAPVALLDWRDGEALVVHSRDTCRLTHFDPRCEWSCVAVNSAIAALLAGEDNAVEVARRTVAGRCEELDRALAAATTTPVAVLRLDGWDQGYAILTTQAAFAALTGGGSFEEALCDVVSKGGDADTNGAVAGALLGARDGYAQIPARWRGGLVGREELVALADRLWELAGGADP